MRPGQCTAAESPLRTQTAPVSTSQQGPTSSNSRNSVYNDENVGLTQQDLQGVGVQVQGLRLLLHHIHLLRLLVVVAVDAGVGQHLQTESRAQSTHFDDDDGGDDGDDVVTLRA